MVPVELNCIPVVLGCMLWVGVSIILVGSAGGSVNFGLFPLSEYLTVVLHSAIDCDDVGLGGWVGSWLLSLMPVVKVVFNVAISMSFWLVSFFPCLDFDGRLRPSDLPLLLVILVVAMLECKILYRTKCATCYLFLKCYR